MCEKIRKDMSVGPSLVLTRKAVVDQTYTRNSSNVCKTIVGIDGIDYSQLCQFSMCEEMPTELYTGWQFDCNTEPFKNRKSRTKVFESIVLSFFHKLRPECKTGKQKNIDCFNNDGYCDHFKTVFKAIDCYYHFCSYQKTLPSLSDQDTEKRNNKREMDDLKREYVREKVYNNQESSECEWWKLKQIFRSRIMLRPDFLTKDLCLVIF